jgi:hypothetical protein
MLVWILSLLTQKPTLVDDSSLFPPTASLDSAADVLSGFSTILRARISCDASTFNTWSLGETATFRL